jgi:membrane-bound lytic murein transglycosylase B
MANQYTGQTLRHPSGGGHECGASRRVRLRTLLLTAIAVALPALLAAPADAGPPIPPKRKPVRHEQAARDYAGRTDVRQFVTEMVERHGFVRSELEQLFTKAKFQPAIIKAITPPTSPQARSWQAYRQNFVNAQRIEAGLRFRERHADTLARASAQYGVPEEIIVSIIGVETVYGRNMGGYRVIDALATLAFDYPPRAEFFRNELEQFLLAARENSLDVLAVKGSYAGAIGIPQFMPGSLRRFGVDYDGNGQANLSDSPVDAIGSVANFLNGHGWSRSQPIAFAARVDGADAASIRAMVNTGIKPVVSLAELPRSGITVAELPSTLAADTSFTLVELETPGQPTEYRIGLQNFYVLTRYNRSSLYASAVFDLAQALRNASAPALTPALGFSPALIPTTSVQ